MKVAGRPVRVVSGCAQRRKSVALAVANAWRLRFEESDFGAKERTNLVLPGSTEDNQDNEENAAKKLM